LNQSYSGLFYIGHSSRDHVELGGVKVPRFDLFEWVHERFVGQSFFDFSYDGIMSLSLPTAGKRPSLLKSLSKAGNLDALTFSLDLTTNMNTRHRTGKLVIGARDESSLQAETKRISLTKSHHVNLTGSWTAKISSFGIKYENEDLITVPFPKTYLATFNPGIPWIILPRGYGTELHGYFGVIKSDWIRFISCDLIPELPDLLFTLGDGQTVRITSKEYVFRYDYEDVTPPEHVCHVAIDDSSYHSEYPDNVVVLGSPFLRGFHSIWDWGSETISCKWLYSYNLQLTM
jgi:Eukaryotic aspartyl protease